MKIAVLGASGMIGGRVTRRLNALGMDVVAASRATGVDAVTGQGLQAVLSGAEVVIDVMNGGDYDPVQALAFFDAAGRNVVQAGLDAGVRHHVVLSLVGSDRLPESGYFLAKQRQEALVRSSALPYSIVRSTQFFEFAPRIVEAAGSGRVLRIAPAMIQPIAADDAAELLVQVAVGAPRRQIEIAGSGRFELDAFVRDYLTVTADGRDVVADRGARYFGSWVNDESLVPDAPSALGVSSFADWLRSQAAM